jgi:hypothetical protein
MNNTTDAPPTSRKRNPDKYEPDGKHVAITLDVAPLIERAKYSLEWIGFADRFADDSVMYHLGRDSVTLKLAHAFLRPEPFKAMMKDIRKDILAGDKTIIPAPSPVTHIGTRTYYNFIILSARVMRNYDEGRPVMVDMHGIAVMDTLTFGAVCTFFNEKDRDAYMKWLMKDAPEWPFTCSAPHAGEPVLKEFVRSAQTAAAAGRSKLTLVIEKARIERCKKKMFG